MSKRNDSATAKRPKLIIVTNLNAYFFAHKAHLFLGLEEKYELILVGKRYDQSVTHSDRYEFIDIDIDCDRQFALSDIRILGQLIGLFWRLKPSRIVSLTIKPNVLAGLAFGVQRWRLPNTRLTMIVPGLGRVFGRDVRGVGQKALRWFGIGALFVSSRLSNARAIFENRHDMMVWRDLRIISAKNGHRIDGTGIEIASEIAPKKAASETLRVAFAGRLLKSKGIDVFLSVAKRFEHRTDIEFHVFGEAIEGNKHYIDLSPYKASQWRNLHFHGQLSHEVLIEKFIDIDVVVLPSRYMEGLPRVLLEAAMQACALISTNQPGCDSIVRDGQTGYLISDQNRDAVDQKIYSKLNGYIDNRALCRAHGNAASVLVRDKKFSAQEVRTVFQAWIESD